MAELSTQQRMQRMLAHQDADRVPITDHPWKATLKRWHSEGMPANVDWADYFGVDKFVMVDMDNSPRFPEKLLEDTPEHYIKTTKFGATIKYLKANDGVPHFQDFVIKDRDAWEKAKQRMTFDRSRLPLDLLKKNYQHWRAQGAWISVVSWFGFDITHSWVVGTERVLEAMVDDPEWLQDIFATCQNLDFQMLEALWSEGYHFDALFWYDDMGFKGKQFFSVPMYRNILKPYHARAVEWAHAKGIKAYMHSCGDIRPFVPELIDIGVDMLNPLEVKAGMDPVMLKKTYGDKLLFQGGINAALYPEPEKLYAQMREVIPVMKQNGGYILGTDHSVPDCVSLEDFRKFVALAKQLGRYN